MKLDMARQAEDHKAILAIEKEEAVREARHVWAQEVEQLKEQWQIDADTILQSKLELVREEEMKKKETALKFENSKFQNEIKDMERRHTIELEGSFRRGVEERNIEAMKEKKSMHEAATKAVNDVKTTAKESIEAAMKDGKELSKKTHKQGFELGRQEANKENDLKVSQLNHAHELALASLQAKSLEEKNAACDLIRKEERKINEDLRFEFTRQREINIIETERLTNKLKDSESHVTKLKNDLSSNKKDFELNLEKQTNMYEKRIVAAIEEEKKRSNKEHKAEMYEYEQQVEKKIKKACDEAEERVAAEMGAAMEQLQEESEKLLGQLEARLRVVEKERDDKISELTESRNELDEHGDTIYDLENALEKSKKENEELQLKSNQAIMNAAAEHAKLIQQLKKTQDEEMKLLEKKTKEAIEFERSKIGEAEKLIGEAESYRNKVWVHMIHLLLLYVFLCVFIIPPLLSWCFDIPF
jgi:hypothetical protein